MTSPFNSPLEIGVRSLSILLAAFPRSLDLQHIVLFDYLTIHSGDIAGPTSLHAAIPLRSGELLVRAQIIQRGILLMRSRHLIDCLARPTGFEFIATDEANPFFSILTSQYIKGLRERANWVIERFGDADIDTILAIERGLFEDWSTQFQALENPGEFKR